MKHTDTSADPPPACPRSLSELFWAFSLLSLQGFGGAIAIAQRELVERRRWLSQRSFLEDWAVAQILPGPNVTNLAIMVGDRYMGARGAFASVCGLFLFPFLLVLLLVLTYAKMSHLPQVQGAMRGMGMVVAALVLTTAFKLLPALRRHPGGPVFCALAGMATFVGMVVLHWKLVWVLALVGGPSCLWTYLRLPSTSLPKERP